MSKLSKELEQKRDAIMQARAEEFRDVFRLDGSGRADKVMESLMGRKYKRKLVRHTVAKDCQEALLATCMGIMLYEGHTAKKQKPSLTLESAKKLHKSKRHEVFGKLATLFLDDQDNDLWQQLGEQWTRAEVKTLRKQALNLFAGVPDKDGTVLSFDDWLIKRVTHFAPWTAIWDYHLSAFHSAYYHALNKLIREKQLKKEDVKEEFDEFSDYDFFNSISAGLGFLINLGYYAVGVVIPEVHRDAQRRLHNPKGPAIIWGNQKTYYLSGVEVPDWLVLTPGEKIDPKKLIEEKNAQVRSEIFRKIGAERVYHALGGEVMDRAHINNCDYELVSLNLGDGRRRPYLKMENPSVPELWHLEGVPPGVTKIAVEKGDETEALHMRKSEKMRKIPVSINGEDWTQQGDTMQYNEKAKSLKPYPTVLT